MKITLKTTIRQIASNKDLLEIMNKVSNGMFKNPSIMQADSMPLERVAGFMPNGLAIMESIIEKANKLLEELNLSDEKDYVQEEIDNSLGLEATEKNKEIVKRTSIKPGQVWRDVEGNRIQAHGGTMFIEDGKYYWIGENKDHTTKEGMIWTWGVKIYSSTDLYNWNDEGFLLKPELKDKDSILYPVRRLDRPHMIYNKRTKKYVLWIKFIDGAFFAVYVSDKLLGEYKEVHKELRPYGANCGDFDLAVDDETGDAYLYFEANHKDLWAAKLNDDYTDVEGEKEVIYENVPVPYTREGVAHVYRCSKHYIFTSGMTGYIPNPSEVAVSNDWIKGYKVLGNPHKNDDSFSSFNSQISNIFKVIGEDRYIAMADRWVPEFVVTKDVYDRIVRVIEARKNPSIKVSDEDKAFFAGLPMIATANTSIANYVWLEVHFDEEVPYMIWQDEWKL
ncbi:MAG: family 43 glycosylhydrolase [Gammaproteobacteria bacterium]|nr:family 43 glycosylhydrolase [Gammaproteobacteria bacterium]